MRKHYLFQNGKILLADNGKTVPFHLPEALTDYVINSGFVDKEDSEGDLDGAIGSSNSAAEFGAF